MGKDARRSGWEWRQEGEEETKDPGAHRSMETPVPHSQILLLSLLGFQHGRAVSPGQPVSPGCSGPRSWVRGRACLAPHTHGLSVPPCIHARDQGNARGSLCPQRGRDQDRQTGLRASAAGTRPFPSTPRPGTWWSLSFCCRKAVFWLSGTQMSSSSLFPHTLWHQQPFGTGGAEAGGAQPPSNPTPPQCLALG